MAKQFGAPWALPSNQYDATMQFIAYGSHLILTGYQAEAEQLPINKLNGFLDACSVLLEPHTTNKRITITGESPEDASLVMLMAESYVTLHAFPNVGTVSCRIFTHRHMLVGRLTTLFTDHFAVGRHESHLGNINRNLPDKDDDLRRILQGERLYTMLQVNDNLVF